MSLKAASFQSFSFFDVLTQSSWHCTLGLCFLVPSFLTWLQERIHERVVELWILSILLRKQQYILPRVLGTISYYWKLSPCPWCWIKITRTRFENKGKRKLNLSVDEGVADVCLKNYLLPWWMRELWGFKELTRKVGVRKNENKG